MSTTTRILIITSIAMSAGLVSLPAGSAPGESTPETVALFDPAALEAAENIAFDHHGNAYVSLVLTGEIRQIAPDGADTLYAALPLGAPPLTFCGPFFGGLTGIAFDEHDTVFANLASCDPESRGVWRLPRFGAPERIAPLPLASLPNGLVHDHDRLYVADSSLGVIWRVPAGGGAPEVFASGPLLAQAPNGLPGPNGLKLFHGELYASNPSQGIIVAVEVLPDGSAGAQRIHAEGTFCDDFAFDVHGNLYCGTDPFNTLDRIAPDGTITTLLTAADGLDGPTATAFARNGDRDELYITNGAFPFFPREGAPRPSLMRVEIGVPGAPLPR
jgi:sugar lactone lactonase YvrE